MKLVGLVGNRRREEKGGRKVTSAVAKGKGAAKTLTTPACSMIGQISA